LELQQSRSTRPKEEIDNEKIMSRTFKEKTYRSQRASLERMVVVAWQAFVGSIQESGDVVVGIDQFLRQAGAFALIKIR
jgi:hypothetical protein